MADSKDPSPQLPPPSTSTVLPPPTYSALFPAVRASVSHAVVDKKDVALVTLSASPSSSDDLAALSLSGAGQRAAVDVVCVVDLSISMDDDATLAGEGGGKENTGLTILDVVKHAVKTVVGSLGEEDRLAIVSFSDAAKVEHPLSSMSKRNQKVAMDTLDTLRTTGSTNIWAGLDAALDVFRDPSESRLGVMLRE
ncbi:hypothetical protein HK101_003097 [Irineochytrium annulatum]|nr:hypothetical protein HK101_003097 [Irineochytrium annulatum]